jgi:hypothetical protein
LNKTDFEFTDGRQSVGFSYEGGGGFCARNLDPKFELSFAANEREKANS